MGDSIDMPENSDRDSTSPSLDRALGQIAIETARDTRQFLGMIFGSAAYEFGEMLGDQMRYWRFKNLAKILGKTEDILSSRGKKPDDLSPLSFGDAMRTIEAASYEEEEIVQDLWARLLANTIDPGASVGLKKVYQDILRSISPVEARLLDLLWSCDKRNRFRSFNDVSEFNKEMNELAETHWRKFSSAERQTAIQNLTRLRCLTFRPRPIHIDRLFSRMPVDQLRTYGEWSLVDPKAFERLLKELGDLIFAAAAVKEYRNSGDIAVQMPVPVGPVSIGENIARVQVREMNFILTALGTDLMRACEKDISSGLGDT